MVTRCPKCGRAAPDDALYCPYCAHGITSNARTLNVSVGGMLMAIATAGFLILLVLSVRALLDIYRWYPQLVAQGWVVYDQLLAALCLFGSLSGGLACVLFLTRKSHRWSMISGAACVLSGGGAWATSMIIPHYIVWYSLLYYFLPVFFTPLVGTILVYRRNKEFCQ